MYCDHFVCIQPLRNVTIVCELFIYDALLCVFCPQAIATRDSLAKALYGALFDWIVDQVGCPPPPHTHTAVCMYMYIIPYTLNCIFHNYCIS